MQRNPGKKTGEFSKRILIAVAVGTIAIVLFTCVMVWITRDLTPLAYVIPAAFAELAVGTGFYYSKAKRENEIKLKAIYKGDSHENQLETEVDQP